MWEQIRSNRRRAWFILAATFALLGATGASIGFLWGGGEPAAMIIGAGVAFTVWLGLWLGSMAGGDSAILRMTGARLVPRSELPQLHNVLEEMSIAAGLDHLPKLYIVDDPAPNAFAAGRKPEQALVAVTTGLLARLNRDELQGVIAHEIGHIKNRDVALMSLASVMIGVIAMIGDIGMRSLWYGGGLRHSRSSRNNSNGAMVAVAVVILVVAPLMAQLLYFSLSRRREYLADACGARFSRYPEGLASALEKISGVAVAQADQSKVTAPIYIVKPLAPDESRAARRRHTRERSSWWATHPPIATRVRILRAMGGAAGYGAYADAAAQVTGSPMIGQRTLSQADSVAAVAAIASVAAVAPAAAPPRPASQAQRPAAQPAPREPQPTSQPTPAESPGGDPPPPPQAPAFSPREASDAFLTASGFMRRECRKCSAVLKIPESLLNRVTQCPRCQTSL